jgi:hypothetical protein
VDAAHGRLHRHGMRPCYDGSTRPHQDGLTLPTRAVGAAASVTIGDNPQMVKLGGHPALACVGPSGSAELRVLPQLGSGNLQAALLRQIEEALSGRLPAAERPHLPLLRRCDARERFSSVQFGYSDRRICTSDIATDHRQRPCGVRRRGRLPMKRSPTSRGRTSGSSRTHRQGRAPPRFCTHPQLAADGAWWPRGSGWTQARGMSRPVGRYSTRSTRPSSVR